MEVRSVCLDRDGVLNEDLPEGVRRVEDLSLLPGALDALARLARARIPTFIITNQANVGRGLVERATVEAIHEELLARARAKGGAVSGIYTCFHAPGAGCDCRKPAPGLLLPAARGHGL